MVFLLIPLNPLFSKGQGGLSLSVITTKSDRGFFFRFYPYTLNLGPYTLSYFTKIGIPKIGQMVKIARVRTINKTMLAGIPAPKNSPVVNCFDS